MLSTRDSEVFSGGMRLCLGMQIVEPSPVPFIHHPTPRTVMSDPPDDFSHESLPTHIPTPDAQPRGSSLAGAVLSFISLILLAFILRPAVPQEDNAVELGILLIAVGFAQVWLIFNVLKSFRK
jgi:hypothetical protein